MADMAHFQRELDAINEQERLMNLNLYHNGYVANPMYPYHPPFHPELYERKRFLMHQIYMIHMSLREKNQADAAMNLRINTWVNQARSEMPDLQNFEYPVMGEKMAERIRTHTQTIDLMRTIFLRHQQGITTKEQFDEEARQLTSAEWQMFIEMLKNILIARGRFKECLYDDFD
ncbi:hypothetical protein CAEBREN_15229 [Caenorhabditis brenneri]|uniref:Uncharacterized protein n=1 Tax=Caenorhabditis brenneri TaxID=135651 RepID=G0NCW6_CAEBE|nr:hypothetical protein CAEBREN_15229 [Caenorhabditis brenneri]